MLPGVDSPYLPPVFRGITNTLVFLVSLFLLERSADVFVDSTAVIAKRFGLPTVLVALLTAGAEWEELAVVVSSLGNHHPSLALSNVLGSMTANILGSLSIGLLFHPPPLSSSETFSARLYTSLLVLLSCFLLLAGPGWGWFLRGLKVGQPDKGERRLTSAGQWAGIVLLLLFALYIIGIAWGIYKGTVIAPEGSDSDSSDSDSDDDLIDDIEHLGGTAQDGALGSGISTRASEHGPREVYEPSENSPLLRTTSRLPTDNSHLPVSKRIHTSPTTRHILRLITSTLLLSLSGYLLSSTTSSLADLLHLSQSTLGLTLLSIATTLPEKLVAYKSGRKSQTGVLIANTVGSNVFLGTLVLGVVWTASSGMPFTQGHVHGEKAALKGLRWIWIDVAVVLASSGWLWLIVWFGAFKRWIGIGMLIAYVVYIVSIFLR